MVKISHIFVANLGNSPAITCDLRLDLKNFSSLLSRPRIDQRFPGISGLACFLPLRCIALIGTKIMYKIYTNTLRARSGEVA